MGKILLGGAGEGDVVPIFAPYFSCLCCVRRQLVRSGGGPQGAERFLGKLIGELSLADADFRTWWAERHPSYAAFATRTYTHPLAGPFLLDWQVLRLPDDDQLLLVMTAPPDTGSLEVLDRLGSSNAT
jgi:MmyB-like transcription regulator ligand binding domain